MFADPFSDKPQQLRPSCKIIIIKMLEYVVGIEMETDRSKTTQHWRTRTRKRERERWKREDELLVVARRGLATN